MKTTALAAGVGLLAASLVRLLAQAPAAVVTPARFPQIGQVDPRYVSYNVEMVEVTGGRFWAPYKSQGGASSATPGVAAVPGLDPNAFRMRQPLDLSQARLRAMARALGPAYVRVSGTWANSTYFHDADTPPPATPPEGFGGVLTRAQWRGVVEFARAADAELVASFAVSQGTRDGAGAWTPVEAQKVLAYTRSLGGRIAAAELFNEPNVPSAGGVPAGYDAAAFGRDFGIFRAFARKAAPELTLLGPGSVGEGGLLAKYPGLKSEAMLAAGGAAVDVFSYHSYGSVSQRCAGLGGGGGIGQTTPEAALSAEWLSRTENDARFYAALRDRFAPNAPLWLTETGETACGGNPWAATFTDTFRYVEQLGRLAKLGVRVVMHNTLSASDYALIDEETLAPRPSYWAAVLWRRLMGTRVLDAGAPPAAGVDLFAHCMAGSPGGVTLVAVNTDRTTLRDVTLPVRGERYTLASPSGLLSHDVQLNGSTLALSDDGNVPAVRGTAFGAGSVTLPPASITFLAMADAGNAACR